MNTHFKSFASMSLWFTIGLIVSVILYKPKLIDFSLYQFDTRVLNTVDTIRIQAPSRILSLTK